MEHQSPGRIEGVQFPFGQTFGSGDGPADWAGTDNCPFFVEDTVAVLVDEKGTAWTSTRLPPLLVQSMVAV